MTDPAATTMTPSRVRYIKLGEHGEWEKECLKKGIVRIGFFARKRIPESRIFSMCQSGLWKDLATLYIADGRNKSTATNFTNQLRLFFEDDGSTLWITFVGERLYWGMVADAKPTRHADGVGVWRDIRGGWRCDDVRGEPLMKDRLSDTVTVLATFRGTSCDVKESKYVIDRLNAKKNTGED